MQMHKKLHTMSSFPCGNENFWIKALKIIEISLQAPFTPFLTEYMYQRMKDYIEFDASEKYTDSIHYLMIPKQRFVILYLKESVVRNFIAFAL
jgi:isoleucyl-tRNA synthetase